MSVTLSTINTAVDKTNAAGTHLGVAALQVEGDGTYTTTSQSLSGGANMYNLQTMTSGFYPCFKFDPYFSNSSGQPIDVYDSTNQNECAYPTSSDGTWVSGNYGTLTNVSFTRGAGGYISNTSSASGRTCQFRPATKTGINHLSTTSGRRTIALWVRTSVATPTAFQYIFCDNAIQGDANYSGVYIQYPSNRSNAITFQIGDGAGTGSGDRRSFLGISNTMSQNEWNFVTVGVYGGATISNTQNYCSITPASSGARNNYNNGVSGTSGTYTGTPVYNSSRYPTIISGANATQSFVGDVGAVWVFPFYMSADDARLDAIFDATKQEYQ